MYASHLSLCLHALRRHGRVQLKGRISIPHSRTHCMQTRSFSVSTMSMRIRVSRASENATRYHRSNSPLMRLV